MISIKKLIKMARKWQKFAVVRRKRISFTRQNEDIEANSSSKAVKKGHFVVYTADIRRFVIPLAYLNNDILKQLLEMSEAEFGLPSDGPILLPYDARFVEDIICFIRRGVSAELQKALLTSVANTRCSSSSLQHGWRNQQLIVQ